MAFREAHDAGLVNDQQLDALLELAQNAAKKAGHCKAEECTQEELVTWAQAQVLRVSTRGVPASGTWARAVRVSAHSTGEDR